MKLILVLIMVTLLCALGMTTETSPEKVKDVLKVIEVPEIVEDIPKMEENEVDEKKEDVIVSDEPLEFFNDETAAADEDLEDNVKPEDAENIEDERKKDPIRRRERRRRRRRRGRGRWSRQRKAPKCVDSRYSQFCKSKKTLKKHCPRSKHVQRVCCASCKKING